LVVAWLSLGLICSLALYTAERGINAAIAEAFDALWWAVGAITTAGSDLFPITLEERLAAMVRTVVGVFLFSAITATITSVLLSSAGVGEAGRRDGLASELERLTALRDRRRLTQDEFAIAKQAILSGDPGLRA
jgi:hypothetical protein